MGRAMHSSFRDLGELHFAFSSGTDASPKRTVANQPTCWSLDSKPKSASSVWSALGDSSTNGGHSS
jgi:hypothetical protein